MESYLQMEPWRSKECGRMKSRDGDNVKKKVGQDARRDISREREEGRRRKEGRDKGTGHDEKRNCTHVVILVSLDKPVHIGMQRLKNLIKVD